MKFKLYVNQIVLSLLIFLFTCFLQIHNFLNHILNLNSDFKDEFLDLLISLIENAMISLILILFFVVLNFIKYNKWISFILFYCFVFYLLFNQVFYSIYYTSYRFGFDVEAQKFNFKLLKDSLLSVLGFWFFINVLVAVLILYFGNRFYLKNKTTLVEYKTKFILIVIAIFSSLTLIVIKNNSNVKLNNPFYLLVKSCFAKELRPQSTANQINFNSLFKLINGQSGDKDLSIDDYNLNNKQRKNKPNIIYIILESVGTLNLMPENKLDPVLTPNLHACKDKSILFPNLYNYFPATTRSHVPILCGGNSITYGSVYEELNQIYTGNTLVSEFKKNGYQTGLFSSQFMEFEGLDSFYGHLPFDTHFMPNNSNNIDVINSWGINEKQTFEEMKNWVNQQHRQPFFIEMMNSGTHHPYSVPTDYVGPFQNSSNLNKYKNAIHYTDYIIGLLIQYLKEKNLYENTIICISGDHGEAFQDRHSNNVLHNNCLYEENIKNFLLILDPNQQSGKQLISNKIGSIGDIMPTILSYSSNENTDVIGQNLFSNHFQSKIHYFYKHSYPKKWGLLDGNWKYIEEITEGQNPELYDLSTDPMEQYNLASKYPSFIKTYSSLIPNWYIQLNKIYRSKLLSFASNESNELSEIEIRSEGPTEIAFGNINEKDEFKKGTIFNPNEKIFVYLKLNPYPFETKLNCVWESPTGKQIKHDFYLDKIWSNAWQPFERNTLLEEGFWKCYLMKDDKVIIKSSFEISNNTKIKYPYYYKEGPIKLQFGYKDNSGFTALEELHPNESIIAFSQINPYTKNKTLNYVWVSPKGKKYSYQVPCNKDWNYTWLLLNEGEPMAEGKWKLSIYDSENKLIESFFRVNHQAKLYQPFQ